jgi:hypothetical protein
LLYTGARLFEVEADNDRRRRRIQAGGACVIVDVRRRDISKRVEAPLGPELVDGGWHAETKSMRE